MLFDDFGTGSGETKYTTMIPAGDKYLTFDFREGSGGARAALQQCKMAGNYTYNTYPTWNAYAFNRNNLPNNNFNDINQYAGVFTTSASGTTLIDNNWGDCPGCHPRGGSGVQANNNGCTNAPATTTSDFSVRYMSTRSYASTGFWVFQTSSVFGGGSNNDDGRRLFIDYNNALNTISNPTQIFDDYGSGSGLTSSSPILISNGTHGLIYDFREVVVPVQQYLNVRWMQPVLQVHSATQLQLVLVPGIYISIMVKILIFPMTSIEEQIGMVAVLLLLPL